jgi:hypothetical protein
MPAPCNAKPISLGSAPWNEVFPIELLSLGILATRSEQNLYRPSDPIPPGFTPWNEIRPKKYPSLGTPVVQLWQNPCNQSYPIPLGFTLWNVCPVDFPDSSGTPLGIQQGGLLYWGLQFKNKVFQKAPPTQC